jgi:hypothetical protein
MQEKAQLQKLIFQDLTLLMCMGPAHDAAHVKQLIFLIGSLATLFWNK